MKQYLKLVTKSLMLLVIIVSTASTGFLSVLNENLDFTDSAQEASANCIGFGPASTPQECSTMGGTWQAGGLEYACIGWGTSDPRECATMGGAWVPVGGGGGGGGTTVEYRDRYPTSCPSGATGMGTPGTASFYCQQTVIQNVNKYQTSCASGLVPKGTPGTASFYCEKPVKQTEYKDPTFVKDINLTNIVGNGEFGSTGERADGQFSQDNGSHSNGWHLNGQGESYKSNHVQFNNIPDNGYVNAVGNSWSPQFTISQGKTNLEVPREQTSNSLSEQQWNTNFSTYKGTGVTTEVIAYRIDELEVLKAIQNSDKGLTDLFTKNAGTYKYQNNLVGTSVDSAGIKDYDKLKINKSGYYIIASKYIDLPNAKKEMATPNQEVLTKHTYYSFLPVNINFMTNVGYLPIQNNPLAQINENMLTLGNRKGNHKLGNLSYQTYKSLKVPSAYSAETGKSLIGSTSGGFQLLDKDLKVQAITGDMATINTSKVSDVIEYNGGFYIATDKGILYLNCENNTLTATQIIEPVNDLLISHNTMYVLTDYILRIAFVEGADLIMSTKEYELNQLFANPSTKAGRIEDVNGLLNISSKDDSTESEVITLIK